MEEYIKALLEQVRFKKAHKGIEDELRAHMEDQIEDNIAAGMDREAAEKAAVADMGDPVEAGISMDRVHRPRLAWNVVAIAVLIGIISSVIHELVAIDAGLADESTSVIGSHVFYAKVLLGLVAMIAVYIIDYTVIAKYAKIIALGMLGILILTKIGVLGVRYNGQYVYIAIKPFYILASTFMLLYIPLYGAIIYKYRSGGVGAFLRALMWMIIPALFVLRWPRAMTAFAMIMAMAVQLSIAVAKGWFKIPKKLTICSLWATITVIPVGLIAVLYNFRLMSDYKMARIRAIWDMDMDQSYVTKTARSFNDVNFVGDTGKKVLGYLPNTNSDFLLTYLANKYGALVVVMIVATVAAIIITGCIAAAKSKNQLGLVMGVGCMNVLLVYMLVNLFENMGAIPYTGSFMPFFSAGGSNIVLAYIFLGIILSIYKYKDAYPQHIDIGIRIKLKDIEL
ncbi:MAG: FtsW/RodA/SpoVE family cell cycle protein [Butyrivibrio sp.]|uniref:FtsW/RodA/SpoVE family cell cycle protein n=1 Tax=Butyrivibrio sp. TaxID=28121 RepID=UPI0025C002C9|nr:FtsW/RodA/SpoVE family cell cycle protein [Butyrivibrio sp.]MBQ6588088.1 FtsW/RodA/SpoVE family cell cycle protein [Butyrivibrio sp.]